MLNSLKLKGIQLSCVLAGVVMPIVSFGAGSLRFHAINKNHKRQSEFPECATLQGLYVELYIRDLKSLSEKGNGWIPDLSYANLKFQTDSSKVDIQYIDFDR